MDDGLGIPSLALHCLIRSRLAEFYMYSQLFWHMESLLKTISNVTEAIVPDNPLSEVIKTAESMAEPLGTCEQQVKDLAGVAVQMPSTNAAATTGEDNVVSTSINPTGGVRDDFYSCCYEVGAQEANIMKMVQLVTDNWETTNEEGLHLIEAVLPTAFLDNTEDPAAGQMKYFLFSRCGFHFHCTINAPQGACGALVMYFAPPGFHEQIGGWDRNSVLTLPHVIMDVRNNTSGDLIVPYINYKNYYDTHNAFTTEKFPHLYVGVLSRLNVGTGTSNVVDVTLFGEMIELDLQCPRVQKPRKRVVKRTQRKITAPPMAPEPNTTIIAPGPGATNLANSTRICKSETLALGGDTTAVDFTSAGVQSGIDDLLIPCRRWQIVRHDTWAATLAPGAQIYKYNLYLKDVPTVKWLSRNFQWYRGSVQVKVVVYGSTFNKGKFQLSAFPAVALSEVTYEYAKMRNALFIIGDITPDGTTLEIPFTSDSWRRNCLKPIASVFLHVTNRLTVNTTTPSTVRLITFVRLGADFEFYCPIDSPVSCQGLADEKDAEDPTCFINFETIDVPIQSIKHTLTEVFFGRSFSLGHVTINESGFNRADLKMPRASHGQVGNMFLYLNTELVVTIINGTDTITKVAHSYDPKVDPASINLDTIMGYGAILIPPQSMKQFVVPYYSETPYRLITSTSVAEGQEPEFGHIYVMGKAGTILDIIVSLRKPNFAFPIGSRKDVTSRFIAEDDPEELGASRFSLLKLCGDVEENPGPVYLAYKWRGAYKHYAIINSKYVCEMDSEDVLSVINGKPSVRIRDRRPNEIWHIEKEVSTLEMEMLQPPPQKNYSWDWNCEDVAREMIGDQTFTQGSAIKLFALFLLAKALFQLARNEDITSGITSVMGMIRNFIMNKIFDSMEKDVMSVIIRCAVRLICYLIMYCHSPNLITTASLITLLIIDSTHTGMSKSTKDLIDKFVNCDFQGFCQSFVATTMDREEAQYVEIPTFEAGESPILPRDEGPQDFNNWMNVFKNIEWMLKCIKKVIDWLREKFCPKDTAEVKTWVEEFSDDIASELARADFIICESHKNKMYLHDQENYKQAQLVLDNLTQIKIVVRQMPSTTSLVVDITRLIDKLGSIMPTNDIFEENRPEPLGIWISGPPGSGKSFLAQRIATAINRRFGWTTYPQPVGSDHMDGYCGQQTHIFDDFGQNREEPDYKLICNLISSVPFIVPQASLGDKGKRYQGRLVIVTTNRTDFTSVSLTDSKALERRFPISITIQPKPQYSKQGKLDVTLQGTMDAMKNGNPWEYKVGQRYQELDVQQYITRIIQQLQIRKQICLTFNQGDEWRTAMRILQNRFKRTTTFSFDEVDLTSEFQRILAPPTFFEKMKAYLQVQFHKLTGFIEQHKNWFYLIGFMGATASITTMCLSIFRNKALDQSPYNANPMAKKVVFRNFKAEAVEQLKNVTLAESPYLQKSMMEKLVCQIEQGDNIVRSLVTNPNRFITYGHSDLKDGPCTIKYKGYHYEAVIEGLCHVKKDGERMDLCIGNLKKLPFMFKNNSHLFTSEIINNEDGVIVFTDQETIFIQEVRDIQHCGFVATLDGTTNADSYRYMAKTFRGACGSPVFIKRGGNYRCLGIHVAGGGGFGYCARVLPIYNEGLVINKTKLEKPAYNLPAQTKLKASPLHGIVETKVGPAPLTGKDPRIEVPIESLVKNAAAKYRVNVFQPPRANFECAKLELLNKMTRVIGVQGNSTFEEVLNDPMAPIDWSTSPGIKYPNRTKRQLVMDENFQAEVRDQLINPRTTFACYLKDELRPLEKVRKGGTRVIEAANFDFVCAYRMVMNKIYKKIYGDLNREIGIGVGINARDDFSVVTSKMRKYNYCMDFSKFDGSLSFDLMAHSVDLLASCHEEPEKVLDIHRTVLMSTHYVLDEVWEVYGGMPSGSPCTSVLNSLCNLLAAYTISLSLGALPGEFDVICYGDDIVISTEVEFDTKLMQQYYKAFFGMEVTSADKTEDIVSLQPNQVSFLKRTAVVGEFGILGALDLDSMLQKIQFTKGNFNQQLRSFEDELVVHGRGTYDKVRRMVEERYPGKMSTYFTAWLRYKLCR